MPSAELNEKTLLEQARQLDEHALSEIHNRYYGEIYRYVLYRTGRTEVADDLASEVFLRFLDNLHTGRTPQVTLRGWLFGVARNLVADHFRHAPREQAELDETFAAPSTTSAEAEHNLQARAVRTALRRLTPEQQHTLVLRFGEGLSVEETAQSLGKSVNAVKVLQFRAVASLRRLVELDKTS